MALAHELVWDHLESLGMTQTHTYQEELDETEEEKNKQELDDVSVKVPFIKQNTGLCYSRCYK